MVQKLYVSTIEIKGNNYLPSSDQLYILFKEFIIEPQKMRQNVYFKISAFLQDFVIIEFRKFKYDNEILHMKLKMLLSFNCVSIYLFDLIYFLFLFIRILHSMQVLKDFLQFNNTVTLDRLI